MKPNSEDVRLTVSSLLLLSTGFNRFNESIESIHAAAARFPCTVLSRYNRYVRRYARFNF